MANIDANDDLMKVLGRNHEFALVRKESMDIYNRLHSIASDIEFVRRVREAYPDMCIVRKCVLLWRMGMR